MGKGKADRAIDSAKDAAAVPAGKEAELVKKAYEVRDLPEGAKKAEARAKLIKAAKRLEKAERSAVKVASLKQEETSLVNQAYKVRDMPNGAAKEQKKHDLVAAAKRLEAKQKAEASKKDVRAEKFKSAKGKADRAIDSAKDAAAVPAEKAVVKSAAMKRREAELVKKA